jgi:hypothetical protein
MTAQPAQPAQPEPDDKDWTWVLTRTCPECGFDSQSLAFDQLGVQALTAVGLLQEALTRPDACVRPTLTVWSPLEYACHVRDVCVLFRARLSLMLTEDDPVFGNWDQDETALAERYWEQEPAVVSDALDDALGRMIETIGPVDPAERTRPGRRSNGSPFTVETLCRYFLHDLVHHAHDVSPHL